MNLTHLGLNVKVIGQGQGVGLTDGHNSTFYCDAIGCALAWRARRAAGLARVGVVTRSLYRSCGVDGVMSDDCDGVCRLETVQH